MTQQTQERPGIEERYAAAVSTSNLTFDEHLRGAAPLLVAAGLSARDNAEHPAHRRAPDQPSLALGGALARLQSEWHSVEKPVRRQPKTIRQWIQELPLVKTGERQVNGAAVPILTRDKEGARARQQEERERLEELYEQELTFLAQKLPSRYWVRARLYAVAVHWGWDQAERQVAEVLRYWLDDTCQTCHGTGEVMVAERVQTCGACEGRKTTPMPAGAEGRRLFALMEESKHAWAQSVREKARRIRQGR